MESQAALAEVGTLEQGRISAVALSAKGTDAADFLDQWLGIPEK